MGKKWRVGLAGLGRGRWLVPVFAAHPQIMVSALCDVDQPRLAEVGKAFEIADSGLYTDYDAFLGASMDAVVIATPIGLHTEQTLKALESGRHVLCEQTAAYTLADCERIVKAVKKSGLQYMMAENYCYFHYIRQWREMVDRGDIGSVYYAEGEYLHPIVELLMDEKTGKFHWRHERPPIWYCAHTLGPVLMLMRDRVVKACGLTSGFTKMPQYKEHPGFLDFEIGLFRTEKGAVVKILRSQVCSRPHTVWYSLYGTKGHLESQRDRGDGLFFRDGMERHGVPLPCSITDPDAPPEAKSGGHGTSEYFMIRDFLDALEANRRPAIDVIRAMDFTVPGLIAHESAMKNGTWLDVPLFNW